MRGIESTGSTAMILATSPAYHKLAKPSQPSNSYLSYSLVYSRRPPFAKRLSRRSGACRSKQSTSVAERPFEKEASANEPEERLGLEQFTHAKPSSRRWKKTAYLRARKQQMLEIPERDRPLGATSQAAMQS